jgi:serine/threonine protein phosphatase 1
MRTLVIGDIHGGLRALQIMERAKVTKEDNLIFSGRLRRWLSSAGSRLLNWIEYDKQLRLYSANHDELHWLRDSKDNLMWYKQVKQLYLLMKSQFRYKTITCWLLLSLKDYYLDEKNRLLFTRIYQHEWALLMNFFQSYFIGTEPMGNCVFRPKNKPNDLLYPKRLTLYDEIYIGHTL